MILRYILISVSIVLSALTIAAQTSTDSLANFSPEIKPGGNYIWVPDSLKNDVSNIINGKAKAKRVYDKIDINEKVIVNGDTVNLFIKERNLGRFDRGLYNYLYIPKGVWSVGLTASYGEFSTEDLQLLSLISDCDFSGHTFAIKPYISYFIRNNLSLGLRLGYTSTRGNLDSFAMDFDEDLAFDIHNILYRSESYTAAIQARQYIGLGRRSRFAVYNEVELAFSSGNSDFTRPYDGVPKNARSTNMDARITFSPGLSVMMMKNASFNISFGVFGYYIHNERQTVDGIKSGNRFTSGANFRFNIFNINFGLAIHI